MRTAPRYGDPQVWRGLRLDTPQPHTWAFYYYLKRCGDEVQILNRTATTLDLRVRQALSPPKQGSLF